MAGKKITDDEEANECIDNADTVENLVRMTNRTDELDVHPTCVAEHQSLGWMIKVIND